MNRLYQIWHYATCRSCRKYLDAGFMFVPKEYLPLYNLKHKKQRKTK
jgi:hypothetical protein